MQRGRHAVAAFGELAGMVLDRLVDAGPRLGEPLDVGVEGRDTTWRAASRRPAKSPARASSMVEVELTMSAISAPILRLALVDHAGKVLAAVGEGRGDFAGALDQRLVDLAGARLERRIELLRAGVERFGAGLEFADQRLAALGERPLDVAAAGLRTRC